jgi:cellulase
MRGNGRSSKDQNLGTGNWVHIETFHGILVPGTLLSRLCRRLTRILKALTCAAKGSTMVFLDTRALAAFYLLIYQGASQQVGHIPEVHPTLTTYKCTKAGGCVARNTSVVLDAELRKAETINGTGVCKGWGIGPLNKTICPDAVTCNRDCALEGANYTQWGVHTSGNELVLKMYGHGVESPRVYLLDETGKEYEDFRVMNGEFTFDTDASNLPCGMCGALYFSEMEMSGGRSDLNRAGAGMGTGYCDAQCYTDFTWVNGVVGLHHGLSGRLCLIMLTFMEANLNETGSCCAEMDFWESNSAATKISPHTCNKPGLYQCQGEECGLDRLGVCGHTGCGFNPFNQGAEHFYGPSANMTIDTRRPFTVVTQFFTSDNTSAGQLVEIRRLWVQDGKVIQNPQAESGLGNSITENLCDEGSTYVAHGGMKGMGESLARGMVLVMSIWNQPDGWMRWLDAGGNGPCDPSEGDPKVLKQKYPGTSVTYSNIRWGEIDSTYGAK